MNPFTIALIVVSIASANCSGWKNRAGQADELQKSADKVLGKPNTIDLNRSRTFALCQQKPTEDHAGRKYKYVVIRVEDLAMVRQGTFSMGSVRWFDDESIEVISGSVSDQAGSTKKIIHVTSAVE